MRPLAWNCNLFYLILIKFADKKQWWLAKHNNEIISNRFEEYCAPFYFGNNNDHCSNEALKFQCNFGVLLVETVFNINQYNEFAM